MKLFLYKVFKSISNKLYPYQNKDPFREEKLAWRKSNGNLTLRLDYSLNSNSIVFDLGGYKGQWASDIFAKYLSDVYIFEPYLPFYEQIKERFDANPRIKAFPFGLGQEDSTTDIYYSDDGTTTFSDGSEPTQIEIKEFNGFLDIQRISEIDLIKINIEGGEYDLLDHIIESGAIYRIKNIQVQFHDKYVENPEQRMKAIQDKLKVTHQLNWQYKFVWENWERKA